MRNIYFTLLMVSFLVACATKPTILYSGVDKVSFSNTCSEVCQKAIKEKYNELRFGMYGAKISGLVILKIDGVPGTNMYGGYPKYNDSWGFNYDITVAAGEHDLLTQVNNYMVYGSKRNLKVNLDAGSEYFLGHIIETKNEGRQYKWKPILFNYTNNSLIEIGEWYGNM